MKRMQLLLWVCLLGCIGLTLHAQESKELIILQTSDVHSRLEPVSQKGDRNYDEGGFVRRATFLKQFRQQHDNMLLVDCGDFSQGTPYYNLFRGEAEVRLMNEMKYDAVAIGNHEFDFGLENMAKLFRLATFPIVCANYRLQGTVLQGLVQPYVVVQRAGLKVGLFGLGVDPAGLVQADKCVGVGYEDPVAVSNRVAAELRLQGCDVVVCLSHLGIGLDEQLIGQIRGVDVVLGGHSHTFMRAPRYYKDADGRQVALLHSGKSGVRVGRLDLKLKRQ